MDANRKVPTSLTLDPGLIGRLDQAAAELDRSRSWVAGYAIEQFLRSPSPPGALRPGMLGTPTCVAAGEGASPRSPGGTLRTVDLHRDVLERQDELARQRSEEAQRQRDAVTSQNLEYLERLNGENSL